MYWTCIYYTFSVNIHLHNSTCLSIYEYVYSRHTISRKFGVSVRPPLLIQSLVKVVIINYEYLKHAQLWTFVSKNWTRREHNYHYCAKFSREIRCISPCFRRSVSLSRRWRPVVVWWSRRWGRMELVSSELWVSSRTSSLVPQALRSQSQCTVCT